jgi:hypothetical protein
MRPVKPIHVLLPANAPWSAQLSWAHHESGGALENNDDDDDLSVAALVQHVAKRVTTGLTPTAQDVAILLLAFEHEREARRELAAKLRRLASEQP